MTSRRESAASIADTRSFFAPRAASWEEKFPHDGPLYDLAVGALSPREGGIALDAACGTGRALPALRRAVGARGLVIGVDVTQEMLDQAVVYGRGPLATMVLGDVNELALCDASCDAIFAAGLVTHFDDPITGLQELARIARHDARLALFHPISRAALAERHGKQLQSDDIRAEPNLRDALSQSQWNLSSLYDGDDYYLAIAERASSRSTKL